MLNVPFLFVVSVAVVQALQPPLQNVALFAPMTDLPDELHQVICQTKNASSNDSEQATDCHPVFRYNANVTEMAGVYLVFPSMTVQHDSLRRYYLEQLGMHVLEFKVSLFDECYMDWAKSELGGANSTVLPYILPFVRLRWLADPPVARVVLGNAEKMPAQLEATSLFFHLLSDSAEVLERLQSDYFDNATDIFNVFGVEFRLDETVRRYQTELMFSDSVVSFGNSSFVLGLQSRRENASGCLETKEEKVVTTTKAPIDEEDGLCYNELPCCADFAKRGKCQSAPVFMKKNCRATCDLCQLEASTIGCKDYFEHCEAWARTKYCINNPDWMAENCRRSCLMCSIPRDKYCATFPATESPTGQSTTTIVTTLRPKPFTGAPSVECYNEEPCCGVKAEQPGACASAYMQENCRAACQLCAPVVAHDADACTDYRPQHCASWARQGECRSNADWMAENCRRSCRLCATSRRDRCDVGGGRTVTETTHSQRPTTTAPSSCGSRVEGACGSCVGGVRAYSGRHSNYYRRLCLTKTGLRIVTARFASDSSLHRAAFLLDKVMENVDAKVSQRMNHYRFQHVVMGAYPKELTTHVPEYRHLGTYFNERARGLGGTIHLPTGSCAEENLMCHRNDRYLGEDITIHEFAHSLHLLGLAPVYPGFERELQGLYSSMRASRSNPWAGDYAMTNAIEYWAEAVQAYFDANRKGARSPATREQLAARDPRMYALVRRYLGDGSWRRSC